MRTYILVLNPNNGTTQIAFADENGEPNYYIIDPQLPEFLDDNGARKVASALNFQMRNSNQ